MKIPSSKIIIDVKGTDKEASQIITFLKDRKTAKKYRQKFRQVANESFKPKGGNIVYLLKFTPVIILMLIAVLDIAFNSVPGPAILYIIAAVLYFYIVIVNGDKKGRTAAFEQLCDDNLLMEESREMRASKEDFETFLKNRDKKLEEYFKLGEEVPFELKTPYDKLVDIDEKGKVVVANPVSYDTETNILKYDLYNETEMMEFPESTIIETELEGKEGYIYIDVLNGITMVCKG